jgi:hypothetical protein
MLQQKMAFRVELSSIELVKSQARVIKSEQKLLVFSAIQNNFSNLGPKQLE